MVKDYDEGKTSSQELLDKDEQLRIVISRGIDKLGKTSGQDLSE